jgi:mRNA-degrading endonuclease toxin of MazEF toxin-antitoxin module
MDWRMNSVKLDSKALFKILNEKDIDVNLASTNSIVLSELNKLLTLTGNNIKQMNIEQAIKTILWQGVLNEYGVFSPKKECPKKFYKKQNGKNVEQIFYNRKYEKGALLSVDFGTSNIGREFSLTHTSVVIHDLPGFIIVIPLTSQKDKQLDNLPKEIKEIIIPVYKKDYPVLENDSFILTHQIKSVSKNRITKEIGTFSKNKVLNTIEDMIYNRFSSYIKKCNDDEINRLNNEILQLKNKVDLYEKSFEQSSNKLDNA